MSELTNTRSNRNDFRGLLRTTASAATLLASVCTVKAADGDSDHSPLWIELGGQFTQTIDKQEAFLPPFVLTTPRPPYVTVSPTEFEKAAPSSWDGTAKIAFEPTGTVWAFSATILYGKSGRNKYLNEETAHPTTGGFNYIAHQDFAVKSSKSHTILDFHAGRDVGLGMFGSGGSSMVSLGVRYAQFNARNTAGIQSQPTNVSNYNARHTFQGTFSAARKFIGIGPSLAWDASANLVGNPSAGSISFDWDMNGAVLFGRQRMRGHHQTTNIYHYGVSGVFGRQRLVYQTSASPNRNKQVIVPSVGGFAGVSWRYPNAKISAGYRADFFFGAMDGGIDVAHRENVGFYGPFASVSVGIGG